MSKVLDCEIIVCEFELQLCYYIQQRNQNPIKNTKGIVNSNRSSAIFCLKKTGNITFDESVLILSKNFSEKTFIPYAIPLSNPYEKVNNNYVTYTSNANRKCDRFKLNDLTVDNSKCLIFVKGLMAERDLEIRSRILSKLEVDLKLTLQVVAEECERIMNLKHDTVKIQERYVFQAQDVCQKLKDREKVISILWL